MSLKQIITFGSGLARSSACPVFVPGTCHGNIVSENDVAYWCYSTLNSSTRLVIYKDSPEGRTLYKLIEDQVPIVEINYFLDRLLLSRLTLDNIRSIIIDEVNDAFIRGKEAKAAECRAALGL